jgi:hypothetical protein
MYRKEKHMNWYRVTTHLDPTKDNVLNMIEDFRALSATKPYQRGVAMFTQSREFNYSEPYYSYFTPDCKTYCPGLLKKYDAEEWRKPDKSEATWVDGHPDTRNLLG